MTDQIHSMDEILELGNAIVKDINMKDINEAVAWKLGWKESDCESIANEPRWHRGDVCTFILPPYSTSIEAAWEIVEKFPIIGSDEYPAYFELKKLDNGWRVEWDQGTQLCGGPEVTAEANTAPLAICKAFLKLP